MDDDPANAIGPTDPGVGELVDHLAVPAAVHRSDGVLLVANRALAALAGATDVAELVGRQLDEVVPPADPGRRQVPVEAGGAPAVLTWLDGGGSPQDPEARFRALVHNATDMVVVHRGGVFTYVSPAVTRVLGWEADELVGRPVAAIVHVDDRPRLHARIAERERGVAGVDVGRYRLRTVEGSWRTVETTSAPSKDPAVAGVVVIARDVTETVEATEALRRSEARHRALVEHLSDVIVVADRSGRILYASPGIEQVVGHPVDDVVGETIFNAIHPDDDARGREQLAMAVAGGAGVYGPERFRYFRADGQWRHLEATASNRLDDPDVEGLVFVLRDVTEQVEVQDQLRHLALHDPLTGLANRTLLTERLDAAFAACRRDGVAVAILVMDLDGFKAVNDQLGHAAGDALLVDLAGRLRSGVRQIDTAGRLGGDEFAVVLPGADDAVGAANRLAAALQEPVTIGGVPVVVGASIGVAVSAGDEDADDLFRRADRAMYEAKAGAGVVVASRPPAQPTRRR